MSESELSMSRQELLHLNRLVAHILQGQFEVPRWIVEVSGLRKSVGIVVLMPVDVVLHAIGEPLQRLVREDHVTERDVVRHKVEPVPLIPATRLVVMVAA